MVAIIRHSIVPGARNGERTAPIWPKLVARAKPVVKSIQYTIAPFVACPVKQVGWPAPRPLEIIARVVCKVWNISRNDLLSERRSQQCSLPRQAAFLLAREFSAASMPSIGKYFNRDHTTILHGIRAAKKRPNREYQALLEQARGALRTTL